MMRQLFVVALTFALTALLFSLSAPVALAAERSGSQTTTVETIKSTPITQEEALEIAVKDAGFVMDDVFYYDIEKDYEDGAEIYEVEFQVGHQEYSYEIEVQTGRIISYEFEEK